MNDENILTILLGLFIGMMLGRISVNHGANSNEIIKEHFSMGDTQYRWYPEVVECP